MTASTTTGTCARRDLASSPMTQRSRWRSSGWYLDLLTAAIGTFAVFLVFQPGSWVRTKWDIRKADRLTVREVGVRWDSIVSVSKAFGDSAGGVDVLVFTDYMCVFCRSMEPVIDSALSEGIDLAFIPVPRTADEMGYGAAVAVACSGRWGLAHRMHGQLMQNTEWQRDAAWQRVARAAGIIELDRFGDCLADAEMRERIELGRGLAARIGVTGTPTMVSRESVHRGVADLAAIREMARED